MRRRRDAEKQYPILSNRPIEISNPQRKARMITAVWVAALVMCTIAGSYIAATVAIDQNDEGKRQLQAELERRSRQRDIEADRFQRALDQYRVDQCRITARLPQDPDVVDIRRRYRCDNPVIPPPAPTPSPAAAPSPADSRMTMTALPRQSPPPHIAPRPAPRPAPGAPGPAPIPQPPIPVTPPPVPPVVPPLPTPGRHCIDLLAVGICMTLEL